MSDFTNRREMMLYYFNRDGSLGYGDQINRRTFNPEGARYRAEYVRLYSAYYDNSQYDGRVPHDYEWVKPGTRTAQMPQGRPYLFKERRPRIVDTMPTLIVERAMSMLLGADRWPNVKSDDNALEQEIQEDLRDIPIIKQQFCAAVRRLLAAGTHIVHSTSMNRKFYPKLYDPRWSRPEFNKENPYLCDKVAIIWDFWDQDDTEGREPGDEIRIDNGREPERYWGRVDIDDMQEVWYNPVKYESGTEYFPPENDDPRWVVKDTIPHRLGFCPVIWLRNCRDVDIGSIDGKSIYHSQLQNFDAINYAMSMNDKALLYSGSPQTILTGLDEQQLESLRSGPNRTWSLPEKGKASYLEIQGKSLERMESHIRMMKQMVAQNVRVIIDDPEEIQGWAVSASAINLHLNPMYDLIDELRSIIAPFLQSYLKQYIAIKRGKRVSSEFFSEKGPKIWLDWKKMVLETPEELERIMNVLETATQNNILSLETRTKMAARTFPVDDVAEEIRRIEQEVEQTRMQMEQRNTDNPQ